jgi:hypothetical protein
MITKKTTFVHIKVAIISCFNQDITCALEMWRSVTRGYERRKCVHYGYGNSVSTRYKRTYHLNFQMVMSTWKMKGNTTMNEKTNL